MTIGHLPLSRWRFRLGAGLVLAFLAFLLWYGFFRTVEVVETEAARRASIENTVSALGVLQPHRYVDVGAQVSGQVKRIAVRVGGTVKKGDLLLEIDPALQQATVSANRATLAGLRAQRSEQEALHDLAQRQAERQRRLAAEDATRQEDVDAEAELRVTAARVAHLKAQIEGAQSVLEGNEALLSYTRIYAPTDGTVVTLDAREGQTLNATYQTPNLLRIADLSRMTVWTEVSEADVGRVQVGMPVYFTTLGLQDAAGHPRRWQGKLVQVLPAPPTEQGSAASSASGGSTGKVVLYTALFEVENTDGALMPQMSAQVFFVIAHAENVLVAPFAALTPADDPDTFTARVLADGKMEERRIKIGARDQLNGEVLEGLKEGEALVTGIRQDKVSGRVRW